MGIDGIEFDPGYHQNLGTFQKVFFVVQQEGGVFFLDID